MRLEQQVKNIIKNVIGCRQSLEEIDENQFLTDKPVNLTADELVFIWLELVDFFQIRFDKEDVADYGLVSINGIVKAVERHIKEME